MAYYVHRAILPAIAQRGDIVNVFVLSERQEHVQAYVSQAEHAADLFTTVLASGTTRVWGRTYDRHDLSDLLEEVYWAYEMAREMRAEYFTARNRWARRAVACARLALMSAKAALQEVARRVQYNLRCDQIVAQVVASYVPDRHDIEHALRAIANPGDCAYLMTVHDYDIGEHVIGLYCADTDGNPSVDEDDLTDADHCVIGNLIDDVWNGIYNAVQQIVGDRYTVFGSDDASGDILVELSDSPTPDDRPALTEQTEAIAHMVNFYLPRIPAADYAAAIIEKATERRAGKVMGGPVPLNYVHDNLGSYGAFVEFKEVLVAAYAAMLAPHGVSAFWHDQWAGYIVLRVDNAKAMGLDENTTAL